MCVVTKLTHVLGRESPALVLGAHSSAAVRSFFGPLRFCFTGDELGTETTTSLYWEGFCVQGSGKGKGTGCSLSWLMQQP